MTEGIKEFFQKPGHWMLDIAISKNIGCLTPAFLTLQRDSRECPSSFMEELAPRSHQREHGPAITAEDQMPNNPNEHSVSAGSPLGGQSNVPEHGTSPWGKWRPTTTTIINRQQSRPTLNTTAHHTCMFRPYLWDRHTQRRETGSTTTTNLINDYHSSSPWTTVYSALVILDKTEMEESENWGISLTCKQQRS